MINHGRRIAGFVILSTKYSLPSVRIAGPFVEDQHAGEVMQVRDLAQLFAGQKVMQSQLSRVAGIARAELQSRLTGDAAAR
jgi:hypothetical protein